MNETMVRLKELNMVEKTARLKELNIALTELKVNVTDAT
jgi:hypothetical protein